MASKKKVWPKVVDDPNSATRGKNKRGGGGDDIGRATQSFPLTPPAPLNRLFGNDGDSVGDLNGGDIHDASSWQPPTYGNDTQDMTCDTMGAPPNAESADQRNTTPANGGDQAPELVEVDASTEDSMARRNKSDMRSSGEDTACVVSICPCTVSSRVLFRVSLCKGTRTYSHNNFHSSWCPELGRTTPSDIHNISNVCRPRL